MKHLIVFDGECPLCHRAIRFILGADKKKQFLFAHLQGKVAESLSIPKNFQSMVLIENYDLGHKKKMIEARATFRIFWLLGGGYRILGLLSFCPTFLFDLGYRFVAKRRHEHAQKTLMLTASDFEGRFLE